MDDLYLDKRMHDISQTKKNYNKQYFTIVYFSYSPWNVLLSHLNGERTMSKGWVNGERTLYESWVNDVWTLNASWWTICERWTMTERGTRTERKRERNVIGERTMNAYSESLGYFPCIVLYLMARIYMYELLNFVILFKYRYFLYKRSA